MCIVKRVFKKGNVSKYISFFNELTIAYTSDKKKALHLTYKQATELLSQLECLGMTDKFIIEQGERK